ncbi:MAG: hypothetical protein U0835_13185 [Isosphaeraceae bacterium]
MIAGQLRTLGYDTAVSYTGADGFAAAAETADTELVLLDHHMTEEGWRLHDTLANLRADARTASLPIYVYAPLNHHVDLESLNERFPGVKLIVTPVNAQILDQQIKIAGAPKPLPAAERSAYAVEAAALLAKVAGRVGSPLGADLTRVEPTLAIALNVPSTADSTAAVLGEVPLPDAQPRPGRRPGRPVAADPRADRGGRRPRPERESVRPARRGRPGNQAPLRLRERGRSEAPHGPRHGDRGAEAEARRRRPAAPQDRGPKDLLLFRPHP